LVSVTARPRWQEEATGPLRVLVVDDNADTAGSIAMFLVLEGLDVRIARSGRDALRIADAYGPHLVLIESWLTDVDGADLIHDLRALPPTADATLVAITGHGDVEVRERANRAGCDEHLIRPFEPDGLVGLVERAAGRAHATARITRRG
jgi:DNA-binding response OmpR family regulator